MLSFDYQNPTRIIYGEGEHLNIGSLLAVPNRRVLLHYGGQSMKRTGLYDAVTQSLTKAGVDFIELGGVRPNPELELVRQGISLCREQGVNYILAVGGGSVIDSAKAIAMGTTSPHDIWSIYEDKLPMDAAPLPVATILTLPAAGSENSPNTVISNMATERKLGYGHPDLRPALSIIAPELFLTLPKEQMAYGACDMLCHIFERYFTLTQGTELVDALSEATMRTIMQQALRLVQNPQDVQAWGQLALAGTLAHNNILGLGRAQSWACHGLEHELSAIYDVPHGAGLAVVVPSYFEHVWTAAPEIFAQWATQVMGVTPNRNTEAVVKEGIQRLRQWYQAIGLPATMQELGIPADADWALMASSAIKVYLGPLPGVKPIDLDLGISIYQHACS